MLRACKRAAACRSRRRLHATQAAAAASSTSSLSTFSHTLSPRAGAEREDWTEVGVFWDMENCTIPSGLDPFVVRPNIERALRTSGFLGPIYLAGYVNINTLSRGHTLESLTESGINVHHVPSGGRDASDRALLIDVMLWTIKHLPPAHVMLISGDSDFSVLLHKLRLLGYNVLLAAPYNNGLPSSLIHAAGKIWIWPHVVLGEPEGLVAETHIPGTPLPESLVSRKKDIGVSKPSMNWREDPGHEWVKDSEGIVNVRLPDGGWLPPYVVDRIINIVKNRPGITLGELIKELKAISINPKLYGYHDYYHCLSRMDELETRYADGEGMRDRVVFNVSSHVADKISAAVASTKDRHVSCGLAGHTEGMVHNGKHEIKDSAGKLHVSADGEQSRKISLVQEKSVTSGTGQSWGSRLLSFIKGS